MPPAAPPTATTSGQAQSNLQSYTGGMQTPDQAMGAANAQYGVNGAQATVQGLRSSLQNTNQVLQQVAPGVMGRTANSLVTSAQANRQIQNESAPIQTQLNNLGQQEQNASQDYQSALGQAQHAADANLAGQTQHQSYLQGIYNDLYTQEQNSAQLAAEKYAADASVKAAGAANASPSFGNLGATGVGAAGFAGFPKGTTPQAAVAQAFQGYKPGADSFYTEQAVLPAIQQLLQANHPNESQDVINSAAHSLVYSYRKATFGE